MKSKSNIRVAMVHSNLEVVNGVLEQKTSGISSMPTFVEKYENGKYGWGSYSQPYTVGTKEEMEASLCGSVVNELLPYLEEEYDLALLNAF